MGFTPATRQLSPNEIMASIANMIISQQVFTNNIGKHQTLVDQARVDGGLFGDSKLYYDTDALASKAWGNDAEAANLLQLHRPQDPKCQAIAIDVFRQISCTVDQYLSKRAWMNEGAFSDFNSVMLGWMKETKAIYDGTQYNVFIGTTVSSVGNQSPTAWSLTSGKEGQEIAQKTADLLVELSDYSRDYNDYGFLRSYADSDIKIIWNSKYVNLIKKYDMPTLFHKEGLVDKLDEITLPSRYFGEVIANATDASVSDATPAAGKPFKNSSGTYTYEPISGNTVVAHFLNEIEIPVYDTTASKYVLRHFFAGDLVPEKTAVKGTFTVYGLNRDGTISATSTSMTIDYKAEFYKENEKIICKVVTELPPYMSGFETATDFFNPKSLTNTNFLTFGRNTLQYFKGKPFITIKKA